MTAGSKAITLIEKFYSNDLNNLVGSRKATDEAKQCALIHVKGIIDELNRIEKNSRHKIDVYNDLKFWNEVLNELNQM